MAKKKTEKTESEVVEDFDIITESEIIDTVKSVKKSELGYLINRNPVHEPIAYNNTKINLIPNKLHLCDKSLIQQDLPKNVHFKPKNI